jgi:hypothetical protein
MGVSRVIDYIEGRTQAQTMEVFERVCDGLHIPGAMLGVGTREWEGRAGSDDGAILESQREWVRERQLLNSNRAALTQTALSLYPEPIRVGDTGFLMHEDWNRPRLFENRMCYRLQDARFGHGQGNLSLGYMRYFDMIDVGEALAHELAITALDKNGEPIRKPPAILREDLPFRRFAGDCQHRPSLLS